MAPEAAAPRDRQLLLVFRRFAVTNALPLRKSTKGGRRELVRWKQKWDAQDAADRDDPAVLPSAVRGQQALFAMKRAEMSIDTVRSILARPLHGYEEAVAETAVFAGEYSLSDAWVRQVAEMIRLTLAIRDAEGHDLAPEEVLDELPRYWTPVGKILTRARMLRARQAPAPPRRRRPPKSGYVPTPPPPLPPSPRSCRDCDAWMTGVHKRRCHACQTWHGEHKNRPLGRCERCRREDPPLKGGHCRGCCLHVNVNGLAVAEEPFTQLWFADPFSVGLRVLRGQLGYELSSLHPGRDRQVAERRAARTPLVPHLAFPGQEPLFTMRRDWTPLLDINRRFEKLPELTEPAQQLADEFVSMMRDQQWDLDQRVAFDAPDLCAVACRRQLSSSTRAAGANETSMTSNSRPRS
ncbi:hypothetical protein [Streptomyces sp. NPDC057257]|uniref:hypothetical protein n=1 Tax=Streptomyces sp. NPDC057257 TaxID=3346071 RepID=UPI003632DB1F